MKRIFDRVGLWLMVAAAACSTAQGASLSLDFKNTSPGTITDSAGNGTGLTDRLAKTGGSIPVNDPNMTLNTSGDGTLTIMTTTNDINGQDAIDVGEYMGIQLSSLGFTGGEDFSVTATFLDSVFTENYDQFGIIIGVASDINVRMGPLYAGGPAIYSANNVGTDAGAYLDGTFAPFQGDDITLNITRQAGIYSFSITNLTTPELSGQFSMYFPPNFLNLADDLMVGVYAASAVNTNPKPVILDSFSVTVGPVVPPAHPGDFNEDGSVDGADFVIWQTHFPTQGGAAPGDGDANADGNVDGSDFVVWQTNFPYSPPASGMSQVPEPNSLLLIIAGAAMAWSSRKWRS
ncbi:MAG: PEP-CTERM sorting domain-containing protein [Pirellulales bacterium]|nr:PEP-CTERM sorting domain-containing protein [Pirellulales bacterium]